MTIDELRAGFQRVTSDVVPMEDPYGRLLSRRKRRLRNRIAGILSGIAAAVAMTTIAPFALQPASPRQDGFLVDSQWSWKTLLAPTRGNIQNQDLIHEIADVFDRGRDRLGVNRSLPKVKVLYLYEYQTMLQVVVAYHSQTHAAIVSRATRSHAGATELLNASGGRPVPAAPFLVTYSGIDGATGAVVGLAPEGCQVGLSADATITSDGRWQRSYSGEPDYDFDLTYRAAKMWQVKCDNEVREVRAARQINEIGGTNFSLSGREGDDWSSADQTSLLAAAAVHHALRFAVGVGGDPRVAWMGPVPEPAVVIGPLRDRASRRSTLEPVIGRWWLSSPATTGRPAHRTGPSRAPATRRTPISSRCGFRGWWATAPC